MVFNIITFSPCELSNDNASPSIPNRGGFTTCEETGCPMSATPACTAMKNEERSASGCLADLSKIPNLPPVVSLWPLFSHRSKSSVS